MERTKTMQRLGAMALALTITGWSSAEPVLEHHEASLTVYLPSGASGVQDILPRAAHRGTNIDGSAKVGNAFGWAFTRVPAEVEGDRSRATCVWIWAAGRGRRCI